VTFQISKGQSVRVQSICTARADLKLAMADFVVRASARTRIVDALDAACSKRALSDIDVLEELTALRPEEILLIR